jgi:tetratricopeptide (TPR) repeat protein
LDSFDRVRSAASELTGLLEACPGLSILVTSRVPLGIGGETIYPVPPLAPDEALDLLVSRAQAFGVRLERADPALVMVAERVECLPLALELAAGRLRLLPAAELATQIEEAVFESGRLEFAPTRQQTVRSMIDWSYELLSEEERQLFARLSVFSASAPLDALRAIAGADLETLSGLVSAGLVRRLEAPGGQAHFGLPAIVQAYARERLRQSGEEPAIARAHAVYFLELARRLRASPPSRRVLEGQGNYWAALDWAKEHDAGLAGELGSVLGELFRSQGRVREQRTVIAALKHMPPPPPTIPKETEARPDSRPPADGPDTGPSADGPDTRADLEQGSTLLETGEYDQAAEQLARVLKRAREARDGALESTAALYLGYAELRRGAYPQALRSLLIALRTIEADETTPLLAAPCFEGFAALAAATGEVVHAARMQGAASSFSGEVVADDVVAKLRSETAATLVALMGQERYGEACAAGAQLSFSEAAAEARIGTH